MADRSAIGSVGRHARGHLIFQCHSCGLRNRQPHPRLTKQRCVHCDRPLTDSHGQSFLYAAEPPDSATERRSLAALLVSQLPLVRAIELTQGWLLGPPPELLGVLRVVVEDHDLPADTGGLALFRALQPEDAAADFLSDSGSERLDQRHWPVSWDAELAWWAACQVTNLHPQCRAAIERIGSCLHQEALPRSALLDLRVELEPLHWGTQLASWQNEAKSLELFQQVRRNQTAQGQEQFLLALRAPFGSPDDLAIAYFCSQAAALSLDGWLAYHAHRRLPSHIAKAAGLLVGAVARRLGDPFWPQFVVRALRCLPGCRR